MGVPDFACPRRELHNIYDRLVAAVHLAEAEIALDPSSRHPSARHCAACFPIVPNPTARHASARVLWVCADPFEQSTEFGITQIDLIELPVEIAGGASDIVGIPPREQQPSQPLQTDQSVERRR